MKVLLAHKSFFVRGGADNSFFQTARLLEANGHEVVHFSMKHNRNRPSRFEQFFVDEVDYEKPGLLNTLSASTKLLYSLDAKRKIAALLDEERPQIAHLHNIYHQISPSIVHVLRKRKIPIVMHLRDYKVVCASYVMLADGKLCDACRGGRYYHAFLKGCVKESRSKSLLNTAEMYLHHKLLDIYGLVDVFISPSRFLQKQVLDMGFRGRVEYLPNFVHAEDYEPSYTATEQSVVYVGRLSREKGIATLIEAVRGLDLTLKIIGDGPLRAQIEAQINATGQENVRLLGHMTGDELSEEIRKCMFVVIPSEYFENNPRAVIEAFALGKPAVGSRVGGIPELVRDGETGYVHTMSDVLDMRQKIAKLAADLPAIERFGRNARRLVETELSADQHYRRLMQLYDVALNRS